MNILNRTAVMALAVMLLLPLGGCDMFRRLAGRPTAEEVEQLVRFAKFPPLGNRGFCPTRDGLWGYDEASLAGAGTYMDRANRETLLIPQCETAGCLAHIEEIAAMEGVDGIFVGPLDLSIALWSVSADTRLEQYRRVFSSSAHSDDI